VVYAVTLTGGGVLSMTLDDHTGANEFDGSLSLRKAVCTARNANDECQNDATNGETLSSDLAAGTYWIVVDGANQSSGDFSLNLTLTAPVCGDGVVNAASAGEACDLVPNDPALCNPPGSPNQCQFAPPNGTLDVCPGEDVFINLNDNLTIQANSFNLTDNYVGTCAGDVGGHDSVHHFHPQAAGTLTITVGNDMNGMPWCDTCPDGCPDGGGCWARVLYARSTCTDAATQIACASDPTFMVTVQTLSFPVTAFGDYFVIVDGNANSPFSAGGPYILEASLTP